MSGNRVTHQAVSANRVTHQAVSGNRVTHQAVSGNRVTHQAVSGNRVTHQAVSGNRVTHQAVSGNRVTHLAGIEHRVEDGDDSGSSGNEQQAAVRYRRTARHLATNTRNYSDICSVRLRKIYEVNCITNVGLFIHLIF